MATFTLVSLFCISLNILLSRKEWSCIKYSLNELMRNVLTVSFSPSNLTFFCINLTTIHNIFPSSLKVKNSRTPPQIQVHDRFVFTWIILAQCRHEFFPLVNISFTRMIWNFFLIKYLLLQNNSLNTITHPIYDSLYYLGKQKDGVIKSGYHIYLAYSPTKYLTKTQLETSSVLRIETPFLQKYCPSTSE